MAGPLVGRLEIKVASAATGSAQEAFVSLYNFFTGYAATYCGVQRIAYYTGSKATGMTNARGMGFHNTASPAGENAWAVFRFASASVPFNMLMQWTSSETLGTGKGGPAIAFSSTSGFANGVIGFAFCQKLDGTDPWLGTTGNDGHDAKNTPVWYTGSNSVWYSPRSNDFRRGANGLSGHSICGPYGSINNARFSVMCDYDSVVLLYLPTGNSASAGYELAYFGKQTPLSGASPQLPYCSLARCQFPIPATSFLGGVGSTNEATTDAQIGSIPHYTLFSGSSLPRIGHLNAALFQDATMQPNRFIEGTSSLAPWNEFPMLIGAGEAGRPQGPIGFIDNIMSTYNMVVHDTDGAGTRMVIGNTTVAALHVTVPWHGSVTPGAGSSRDGTDVVMRS